MEFVILGFLMIRALSQYDLMKALKQDVSPFYQPSLGSLQSALRKLEQKGYIEVEKTTENGRKKNVYSVTDSGKQHFHTFMTGEIIDSKFEAQTSTRLFFMGHITKEDRLVVTERIINYLEETISKYEEGEGKYNDRSWPEEMDELVMYQFKTLSLGIHSHRSNLAWFKSFREELEAE